MFKVKQLGVAAAVALFAGAAMASNFRAADQVYLPAAGHVVGAGATFVSDVFISNLTGDQVDVSITYSATPNGTQQSFPNKITLAPNERRELPDFMLNTLGLSSAFGQVIFNGCKSGQTCTPDPVSGLNVNYRNISVESRIYSFATGTNQATAPTNGQLFSGIPWYNFVSSQAQTAGLDKIFITGIRNTSKYKTNLGFVNASSYSTTTLTAVLKSGTGAVLGTNSFTLQPLGVQQVTIGSASLFPSFVVADTSTNAYVEITQSGTTPTADAVAAGCDNGCPAFFAYGSQLDNATQDATTLEPQYTIALTANAITCIYSPDQSNCKVGTTIRRAAKR